VPTSVIHSDDAIGFCSSVWIFKATG